MRYEAFERRAHEEWRRIPAAYKAGIDGLTVERDAQAHPSLTDVYTLGECVTESYPSDFGGPDTIRSFVVLYYGSFRQLARLDEDFDWEGELWETLTHELQHHLESLAADSGLIDVDYAMDENFKRMQGEPFDTAFYRAGVALGGGWYRVEDGFFLELHDPSDNACEFEWLGVRYRVVEARDAAGDVVAAPFAAAGVTFLHVVDGLADAPRALYLVARHSPGWRAALRAWWRRALPVVREHEVSVEPVSADG